MTIDILEELDLIIKDFEDTTILGEFANTYHHLEVGERGGTFFVRLDGALLFVSSDPERAFALFYDQISKVYDDEQSGSDPGFSTLREILVSRSKNIKEQLERLGKGALSKAIGLLEFTEDFTEESIFKDLSINLLKIRLENVECRSCAKSSELVDKAHEGTDGMQYIEKPADGFVEIDMPETPTVPPGTKPLSGPGEVVTDEPKTNNVTHGSTMADGQIKKAEDIHLSTKAIILDSEGRILLLKDSGPEGWDDVPGGHIKNYETIEEGLRREVFEECGLLVTSSKQLFTKNLKLGNPPVDRPVVFFIVSAMGNIRLSEEHTDYVWADPRVLDAYNLGVFLPVIGEALVYVISDARMEIVEKGESGGHEMEVTDLGMPYDTQSPRVGDTEPVDKHHEPSSYDMGEPNAEVDNLGGQRHDYPESKPTPEGENVTVRAGLTNQPPHPLVNKGATRTQIPMAGDNTLEAAGLTEGALVREENVFARIPNHKVPYTPDIPNEIRIKMSSGKELIVPVNKSNYSEAGNPVEREKPYIEADHDSSTSSDTRDIGVFGSGAVIDLPEELDKELGVKQGASSGAGSAGEGVGSVGTVGPVTTGDTFTPTYGPGGKKQQHSDFDSALAQKQHDMDVIGTNEGISTLPSVDAYDEGHRKYSVTRNEYEQEIRHKNEPRSSTLSPEQRPLGEGEMNIWLSESGAEPNNWLSGEEKSPNTRLIVTEGMDGKPRTGNFDEAQEQYTNLSNDILSPFLRKSVDTLESLHDFAILSNNALQKASAGKTLIVAGWGSYYVVDREGHRISLSGLQKAFAEFLRHPEYANMNIFHSGIQVGRIIPEFLDERGKLWRSEVTSEGLFVVCEFRTDLEVSRRAMAEVLKGTLRGFSIAGNSNPDTKQVMCDHGVCWEEILDLEIYEVTLCQTPMNQKSWITDIVQRPDADVCSECYETPFGNGYDSSLRPT